MVVVVVLSLVLVAVVAAVVHEFVRRCSVRSTIAVAGKKRPRHGEANGEGHAIGQGGAYHTRAIASTRPERGDRAKEEGRQEKARLQSQSPFNMLGPSWCGPRGGKEKRPVRLRACFHAAGRSLVCCVPFCGTRVCPGDAFRLYHPKRTAGLASKKRHPSYLQAGSRAPKAAPALRNKRRTTMKPPISHHGPLLNDSLDTPEALQLFHELDAIGHLVAELQ